MASSSETTRDLISGWVGGVAGILISNPLEVWKVRLQTTQPSSSTRQDSPASRSPSPAHHLSSTLSTAALARAWSIPPAFNPSTSIEWIHKLSRLPNNFHTPAVSISTQPAIGLRAMWKQEGWRFLFAGVAGPIIGLAFIDSFFFASYGRCMATFQQDRQDPSRLSAVFASGAAAGALSAILQTPIEVVKCRAQAEGINPTTAEKAGSLEITRRIAREQGVRGFYVGGLTTALRDSLSSGIFFSFYIVFRRLLRGEAPSYAESPSAAVQHDSSPSNTDYWEVGRILLAGGLAGSLSAILPYPMDIVKTRLQVAKVSSTAYPVLTPPAARLPTPLTVRRVISQINHEGRNSGSSSLLASRTYRFFTMLFPRTLPANISLDEAGRVVNLPARKWALKTLGLGGFYRGLRPTVMSSFVGSAVTIAAFEVASEILGMRGALFAIAPSHQIESNTHTPPHSPSLPTLIPSS